MGTGWLGMDVSWTHWIDRLDILAGIEIFGRLVIDRFGFDAGQSVSSTLQTLRLGFLNLIF